MVFLELKINQRYFFSKILTAKPNPQYLGFVWFRLVSLFNGISTFIGYLMPKPFSKKNSSGII